MVVGGWNAAWPCPFRVCAQRVYVLMGRSVFGVVHFQPLGILIGSQAPLPATGHRCLPEVVPEGDPEDAGIEFLTKRIDISEVSSSSVSGIGIKDVVCL